MAHGGARPGAGRKAGAATKKTREIADRAAAEGITPLDVMLTTMRSLWDQAITEGKVTDMDKAVAAHAIAKDAAPFIHPKLSNIAADVNANVSIGEVLDGLDG